MRSVIGRINKSLILVLLLLVAAPVVSAQDSNDLDAYKYRVTGLWWFSHPTGNFRAAGNSGYFDLNADFHFAEYSTFSGRFDWRFKRKHHFVLGASPISSSRTVTLNRDITFRGNTYAAGTHATAEVSSLAIAPGYQYDILRRKQGSLLYINNRQSTGHVGKDHGNDHGERRLANEVGFGLSVRAAADRRAEVPRVPDQEFRSPRSGWFRARNVLFRVWRFPCRAWIARGETSQTSQCACRLPDGNAVKHPRNLGSRGGTVDARRTHCRARSVLVA
jgi:hypothetical protein